MRNLKRALSLTLASVMLLGMMVVGAGAASYPDVSEEDNIEAIEVLQAVQVMRGDDKGNFNPDSPVTRAEMAVVMALLLDLDYQYYEVTCPFTDVPSWARSYVGACYANKIVAGYDATTYGANDSVTAVQASAMMMRALGYFQTDADYADGFETATVRQGTRIGIYDGVGSRADQAMTRNQVAQMALNALECTMVDARKSTSDITVGSGDTAVTINGSVEYIVRTSRENFAKAINRVEGGNSSTTGLDGNTVELGEQLYNGDLKKTSAYDAFGAPSVRWVYKNAEIGVYANDADAVYTAEVKSKDIYADLGLSGTVTAELYVDGVEVEAGFSVSKSGDAKLGGNGVLVKAYETGEDSVIINVINSYVGEITKVTEAKGSDARNVKVDSFSKTFETEAFDEEDIVVYTVAKDEIQSMYLADIVSDVEITKTVGDSEFTADGNVYKYTVQFAEVGESTTALVEDKSDVKVENRLDLYLDSYGYVVKVNLNEGTTDYAYVLDIDEDSGKLFEKGTPYARLLLTDGTTVDAKLKYSDYDEADTTDDAGTGSADGKVNESELATYLKDNIVEYSKTSKDVYTLEKKGTALTALTDGKTITIDSGKAKVTLADDTVYADGKTVFLTDDGDENYKAYTGRDNVPNLSGVYSATASANAKYAYYCENGSVATVIYVLNAETSSNDIVFLLGTECDTKPTEVKDGDSYYECPAVFNNEIVTLRLNNKITENVLLKSITYSNEDEEIIDTSKFERGAYSTSSAASEYYVKGDVTKKLSNTNLSVEDVSYGIDSDKIRTFVYSDKIETSTARQIDVDDYAWLVINDGKVVTIFYSETADSSDPDPDPDPDPEGGATEDPTAASNIDEYAGTMDVDFVHGAAGGAQKVAEDALKAEGFTITGRDQSSKQVTATKDGIETTFTYTDTEYFTVKVDDTTYYVTKAGYAKGTSTELKLDLNADTYDTAATDGTGYLDGAGAYKAYATTNTTVGIKTAAMGSDADITDNKVIKTGYVKVENFVTTSLTAFTVEGDKPGYAAVNSTIEVKLTVPTTPIELKGTGGSAAKIEAGETTATIVCSKSALVGTNTNGVLTFAYAADTDNLVEGDTITITYKVGTADISAITIAYTAKT